jgi:hypothetical protein
MKTIYFIILVVSLCGGAGLCADPPPAGAPSRMPPVGIEVPPDVRSELERGIADFGWDIEDLKIALKSQPEAMQDLLPDVQIYYNAVRYALEDDLFYKTNDFDVARKLLAEGRDRAKLLTQGQAPWTTATGLVVRGYKSRIDGSAQPYGMVVPDTAKPDSTTRHPLDIWLHGRNERLSEMSFITDRESKPGEFTPADTYVLHPYGRYCNAYKFAGETDVLEALESARKRYSVDENRVAMRGFSMGGAGAWHLAVHHAGMWAVASPGAGFVDTAVYQANFLRANPPPWYEERLWHLYDAIDYAANLFNCPVIAYSGEIDPQRAAATEMAEAMAAEGITLTQVIGTNTAHKWEPHAKAEVARLVDDQVAHGRDPMPRKVRFTTWTLRYNQMRWVTVDGLDKHWERARVDAAFVTPRLLELDTANVSALTLSIPDGLCPLDFMKNPKIAIDQQEFAAPALATDLSWTAHFEKVDSRWSLVPAGQAAGLRKVHGLQGPIDDAFMDSFIMVRPTGKAINKLVGTWTTNAMAHAIAAWRLQFRGQPKVKDDIEVTEDDIASANLVLWGDPRSNDLLARIAPKLPIQWTRGGVIVGGKTYSSDDHIPVLIYPNPLNPKHYVVVNSGFTFSGAAPLSNALQVPKLPDYAIFDIGKRRLSDAGFFDDDWNLAPEQ